MVVQENFPRLDVYLSQQHTQQSRAFWQRLIVQGHVLLNQQPAQPKSKLRPGDVIHIDIPAPQPLLLPPAYVAFDVLYEDAHLLVVNKPQGLCVHPAATTTEITLVQGLLHHCQDLSGIGGVLRPGIVHRLDKGTSGCLVVAKNDATHVALQAAFAKRQVHKQYLALVFSQPKAKAGTWETPYGRHTIHRRKYTAQYGPKRAITQYEAVASAYGITLMRLTLHTGRTHQLRVHLSEAGLPIIGDPLYGSGSARAKDLQNLPKAAAELIKLQKMQMLHAQRLQFVHPHSKELVAVEAPPPNAMQQLVTMLTK